MEILCSCKQIAQAICEGGWPEPHSNEPEDEEESENPLVQRILEGAKKDKLDKAEQIVEELNLTDDGNEKIKSTQN